MKTETSPSRQPKPRPPPEASAGNRRRSPGTALGAMPNVRRMSAATSISMDMLPSCSKAVRNIPYANRSAPYSEPWRKRGNLAISRAPSASSLFQRGRPNRSISRA